MPELREKSTHCCHVERASSEVDSNVISFIPGWFRGGLTAFATSITLIGPRRWTRIKMTRFSGIIRESVVQHLRINHNDTQGDQIIIVLGQHRWLCSNSSAQVAQQTSWYFETSRKWFELLPLHERMFILACFVTFTTGENLIAWRCDRKNKEAMKDSHRPIDSSFWLTSKSILTTISLLIRLNRAGRTDKNGPVTQHPITGLIWMWTIPRTGHDLITSERCPSS